MLKNKIIKIIILLIIGIVMIGDNVAYATNPNFEEASMGGEEGTQETPEEREAREKQEEKENKMRYPDLNNSSYEPTVTLTNGGTAMTMVVTILNVLTVLGVVAIVISIAFIGFGTILGSASAKAAGQEKYVGILIASLLIVGGSTIAKFIIHAAETAL